MPNRQPALPHLDGRPRGPGAGAVEAQRLEHEGAEVSEQLRGQRAGRLAIQIRKEQAGVARGHEGRPPEEHGRGQVLQPPHQLAPP
jgi:hypothetical protein